MTCVPALPAQPCRLLAWRHCSNARLHRTCSRPSAASRQSYGAPNRSRRTSYPTPTSASINSWYIDVSCADAYSLSQTRTLASQYCVTFPERRTQNLAPSVTRQQFDTSNLRKSNSPCPASIDTGLAHLRQGRVKRSNAPDTTKVHCPYFDASLVAIPAAQAQPSRVFKLFLTSMLCPPELKETGNSKRPKGSPAGALVIKHLQLVKEAVGP